MKTLPEQTQDTDPFNETNDLRNSRIYKEPAFPLAYDPLPFKTTDYLEVGTQQEFIDAAWEANLVGMPLNALLTVRLDEVLGAILDNKDQKITATIEKIRKWLRRNDLPVFYTWVREVSEETGEHWHLALHLTPKKHKGFARFVGTVFDDEPSKRAGSANSVSEIARSDTGSWQLSTEYSKANDKWPGYWLAAYLGKGEPSLRMFRGNLIENIKKPVKGPQFEGTARSSKYDAEQGRVIGNANRKKRFDISKDLKRRVRAKRLQ